MNVGKSKGYWVECVEEDFCYYIFVQIGIDMKQPWHWTTSEFCLIEFYVIKKAVPTPSSVNDEKLPEKVAEMAVAARPACIPFFSYTNVAQ